MKKMKTFHLSFNKLCSLLFLCFFFLSYSAIAQNITIQGKVGDVKGEPIIGATVVTESDLTVGTVTDYNGEFNIKNIPANSKLIISYVGMENQIIDVDGRTTINVVLIDDSELLDEVIVVADNIDKYQML